MAERGDRARHRSEPGDRRRHRRAFGAAGASGRAGGPRRRQARGGGRGDRRRRRAGRAVPCDVTVPASVDALFARIVALHGRLDVVFNNAGANRPPADRRRSWEEWRQVVSVNLDGAFLIAARRVPADAGTRPRRAGGSSTTARSRHTYRGRAGRLHRLEARDHRAHPAVSLDGRAFGIACGQIDIGNAASDMTADKSGGVPQADGGWRRSRRSTSSTSRTRWCRWPNCRST